MAERGGANNICLLWFQKWMLDELKKQGEVGIVLEYILEKKAGFKYQPEK